MRENWLLLEHMERPDCGLARCDIVALDCLLKRLGAVEGVRRGLRLPDIDNPPSALARPGEMQQEPC